MAEDLVEPARQGPQDRRSLQQRALACELTGRLDRALALIRRLRATEPTGRRPAIPHPMLSRPLDQASFADRRIA
jgi:Flp pilus assembly protein TadD